MKRISVKERGLYSYSKLVNDDGSDIQIGTPEYAAMEAERRKSPGRLYGLTDFLDKAEALANEKHAAPNDEFAGKLKDDIHMCRRLLARAEFRGKRSTPEQIMKEAMYRGVIVTLSYWRLKANVQWEKPVNAVKKQRKTLDDNRPPAKITRTAYDAAKQKAPKNQSQRARLLRVSRQALVEYEKKQSAKK